MFEKIKDKKYVHEIVKEMGLQLAQDTKIKYLGHTHYKNKKVYIKFLTRDKKKLCLSFEIEKKSIPNFIYWCYDEFQFAEKFDKELEKLKEKS